MNQLKTDSSVDLSLYSSSIKFELLVCLFMGNRQMQIVEFVSPKRILVRYFVSFRAISLSVLFQPSTENIAAASFQFPLYFVSNLGILPPDDENLSDANGIGFK